MPPGDFHLRVRGVEHRGVHQAITVTDAAQTQLPPPRQYRSDTVGVSAVFEGHRVEERVEGSRQPVSVCTSATHRPPSFTVSTAVSTATDGRG